MAWIELHEELLAHPKTTRLGHEMGWGIFETIGRLVSWWHWVLKYRPTGDLRGSNDDLLSMGVALNGQDARRFVVAMIDSGWIDRADGIFRVHDWAYFQKRFLKTCRFKDRPDKWLEVEAVYPELFVRKSSRNPTSHSSMNPTNDSGSYSMSNSSSNSTSYSDNQPTNQPTNQPEAASPPQGGVDAEQKAYDLISAFGLSTSAMGLSNPRRILLVNMVKNYPFERVRLVLAEAVEARATEPIKWAASKISRIDGVKAADDVIRKARADSAKPAKRTWEDQ